MVSLCNLPTAIAAGNIALIDEILSQPITVDLWAQRSRIAMSHGCHHVVKTNHREANVAAFEAILRHPNVDVNELLSVKGTKRHVLMSLLSACQSRRLLDVLLARRDLELPVDAVMWRHYNYGVSAGMMRRMLDSTDDDVNLMWICLMMGVLSKGKFDASAQPLLLSLAASPSLPVNRGYESFDYGIMHLFGEPLSPDDDFYGRSTVLDQCIVRCSEDRRYFPLMRRLLAREDIQPQVVKIPQFEEFGGKHGGLIAKYLLAHEQYDIQFIARIYKYSML